jgi:hypothetical protein
MYAMPRGPLRDYFRALGLSAVYVTRDGVAHAAAAPRGDVATVMWTNDRDARTIALRINKGMFNTIQDAAMQLGIDVTEHSVVLERAADAVRKVNTALAHAKARGELRSFDRAFAEYRRKATEQGKRAYTYAKAYTRLRAALFVYATKGIAMPSIAELISSALGGSLNARESLSGPKQRARHRSRCTRPVSTNTPKFT